MNIFNVIQKEVNKIALEINVGDKGNAMFVVSILDENPRSIIVTCINNGMNVSRRLFPKLHIFEYDVLRHEVRSLYNATL